MNSYDDVFPQIIAAIDRANDIALYCHTNPDGDALGSMLAIYSALSGMGKTVCAYCDSAVPDKYRHLIGCDAVSFPEKTVHEVAICVDCADMDRLGACKKSYLSAKERIAIDHHGTFTAFGRINFADAKAAACAEIIYILLDKMGLVGRDEATLLFGAIVTDSGCFAFSNTTKRTHMIACELLDKGIDASDIIYNTYRKIGYNKFRLKNAVLADAKFFEEGRIAVIIFTKDDFEATDTGSADTEGIISELVDIDTVQIAFSLAEVGERSYKVSIRSKGSVNSATVASTFGGGGHVNAAGCRISGYVEDIVDRLVFLAKTVI